MTQISDLPLPDAQRVLIDAVTPLGTEMINTSTALGRVLAQDVITPRNFPDTPRSAVDGYALGQIGRQDYQIVQTLGAGVLPQVRLQARHAAAVMTGATLPEGSRAVVRIEESVVKGATLAIDGDVVEGDNINQVAEEMAVATTILDRGTKLTPVAYSVLCCTGIAQVKVYRLPRVGILITGDEVLQLGMNHLSGRVYDSNRHFLASCFAQLGIACKIIGPVNDDEMTIRASLDQLARECDLVISSGGVSMGKYDFIRPLLHSGGFELLVNRTGIKPGRPMIAARRDKALFFGMPGYPAACLVNFFFYLLPAVKKMIGLNDVLPRWSYGSLVSDLSGRKGRWDVVRVQLKTTVGRVFVDSSPSQLTSHFLNMGRCDGLVVLDAEMDHIPSGTDVAVLHFDAQF